MYFLYIIKCKDNSFYTGITTNIKRRFKEHRDGRGGKYTRSKGVTKIVYTEECQNRSFALKRESEIKGWNRVKKLNLIKN